MTFRGLVTGRAAVALVLCGACGDAAAQTARVHDAERARAAATAAEAFRGASSSVFDAMLANVDAADTLDRQLLIRRNELRVSATVANLPSWTWSELAREIESARAQYRSASESALAQIAERTPDLPSLSDALAEKLRLAREARVARAAEVLTGKFATAEQFREAIARLLDVRSPGPVGLDELAGVPVALRTLLENAQASANARGLQLTLLQLGSDLADAGVARAREELRLAKWEIGHAEAVVRRVHDVETTLGRLGAHVSRQPPHETIESAIRAAAERAAGDPRAETGLAAHLATLSSFTALIGYESVHVEEASLLAASERQRAAIRLTETELEVDAALVRHGLTGLETYYAGGLRPVDLANLFRALQTIALAVLAGSS